MELAKTVKLRANQLSFVYAVTGDNQAFAAMTAARERADQLAASRQSPAAGTDVPRASWDDYFLQIASTVASRSTCVRRQVGAVVAADRHIVATGYNGPPSGMPHCDDGGCLRATAAGVARSVDYSSCVAVHAGAERAAAQRTGRPGRRHLVLH